MRIDYCAFCGSCHRLVRSRHNFAPWGGPALAPSERAITGEGSDAVEVADEQIPSNVGGVDVDCAGNFYTTEVNTGRRVQRSVFQASE